RRLGATLYVYNGARRTFDRAIVSLPATAWSAIGGGRGYRFKAPPGAPFPVSSIVIKQDVLLIHAGGPAWTYTLDERRQDRVAFRLVLADGTGWCANVPPAPHPGSDQVDRFTGDGSVLPAFFCPLLP